MFLLLLPCQCASFFRPTVLILLIWAISASLRRGPKAASSPCSRLGALPANRRSPKYHAHSSLLTVKSHLCRMKRKYALSSPAHFRASREQINPFLSEARQAQEYSASNSHFWLFYGSNCQKSRMKHAIGTHFKHGDAFTELCARRNVSAALYVRNAACATRRIPTG